MKTRLYLLSCIVSCSMLIGMISGGGLLYAQQTSPDAQQPSQQTQPPPDAQTPPSQSPDQSGQGTRSQSEQGQTGKQTSPDAQAQSSDQTGGQTFTGTVIKKGNKYVLQDASGKTYDVDHQDEVSKFEGKRVRIQGTLDPSGKMIQCSKRVQQRTTPQGWPTLSFFTIGSAYIVVCKKITRWQPDL